MRGWKRSVLIYTTALTPFLIWAALSLLWTQHFDLTSKRLVLLAVVYAGIFGGICDLSYQRTLSILRVVLIAALILNFAVVFAMPDIGMHKSTLWRGFMAHKNIAGMLCTFTVIMFVFDGSKLPRPARLAVITGALVFLVLTWSKTALITLPIAIASGGAIALIRDRHSSFSDSVRKAFVTGSRVLLAIVIVALIVLTLQRDFLLSLTNDTSTLTTRGAIWRPMIQFYLDSSFLGSGYGAYWDASEGLIDPHANKELWRNVDQGHNGYLDLLVQVGLPGLALALHAALAWPLAQLATVIGRQPQRAALIFAVLVFSLIENFSESSLFADDALGNCILLIALAQLHRIRLRSAKEATVHRRRRSKTLPEMPFAE
ncbi:hypothetical protein NS277_04255 [Novosphingobium barchaimii]|nr:hypothetical protein NS277_04255 [Novosphingobium barchaimii]